MNLNAQLSIFSVVACMVGATTQTYAQSSRDELVARGAKALSADELRAALTGSEISGANYNNTATLAWNLNADGTIIGTASYSTTPIRGTWSVNEKGQFCFDHESSVGRDRGCQDWFVVGSEYYATRGQSAMKRQVKKL